MGRFGDASPQRSPKETSPGQVDTCRPRGLTEMLAAKAVLALGLMAAVLVVPLVVIAAPAAHTAQTRTILFPAGSVVHIVGFSPIVAFTVHAPGGQFIGAASVDHFVWLMPWTNGTPLPECPDVIGYIGTPWIYSPNEFLASGSYYFGPVCGGFANLTVSQDIEVVYS